MNSPTPAEPAPRWTALLLRSLAAFGLVSALWYWFESRWDRRLFSKTTECACLNLNAPAARQWLLDQPHTQVLDVRSPREFQGGCIPGAINIPLGSKDFPKRLSALDPNLPVLVYCAGGYRSRKAVEQLKQLGFKNIQHLHRGFLSWKMSPKSPPHT